MRWTRSLASLSAENSAKRGIARRILTHLLIFDPAVAPADIGGAIELLYELQIYSGEPFNDPLALLFLRHFTGDNKAGRFSQKLLKLGPA